MVKDSALCGRNKESETASLMWILFIVRLLMGDRYKDEWKEEEGRREEEKKEMEEEWRETNPKPRTHNHSPSRAIHLRVALT